MYLCVADVTLFRRRRVDFEDLAATGTAAPAGKPLEQHRRVDVHQHDRIDRLAELGQERIESLGLRNVAWVPVEYESRRRIRAAETLADQAEDDLVGHELARVHCGLGTLAELRAALDRVTQQIAGRHLRDALFVA